MIVTYIGSRQNGSGLIETLLFISVFTWLMSTGLVWLWETGAHALMKINSSRSELLQPLWEKRHGKLRGDDHFAKSVRPILNPLQQWGGIHLATETVRVMPAGTESIAVAVLENSWAPHSLIELTQRQQNLTSFGQIQRTGLQKIVHGFGLLPIAREFSENSFRFGWSNPDATLYELKCAEASCDE